MSDDTPAKTRWTPSAMLAQEGNPLCSKCGTTNPIGAHKCSNSACRAFLPSNAVARKHGFYARHRLPPEVKAEVEAQRAGIISDLGGESELTTLEASYVDKLSDIEACIKLLTMDIAEHGLITGVRREKDGTVVGGRVRDVYDKLLAGLAAFDRYAVRVGLERRAKPVRSLVEVMEGETDG
ncbi:MAG: hypothetical protein Q7J25_11350 [Vicinamibacterales bacterium]|nr:hypothetical protein [Vicinamibacterales bacterium]